MQNDFLHSSRMSPGAHPSQPLLVSDVASSVASVEETRTEAGTPGRGQGDSPNERPSFSWERPSYHLLDLDRAVSSIWMELDAHPRRRLPASVNPWIRRIFEVLQQVLLEYDKLHEQVEETEVSRQEFADRSQRLASEIEALKRRLTRQTLRASNLEYSLERQKTDWSSKSVSRRDFKIHIPKNEQSHDLIRSLVGHVDQTSSNRYSGGSDDSDSSTSTIKNVVSQRRSGFYQDVIPDEAKFIAHSTRMGREKHTNILLASDYAVRHQSSASTTSTEQNPASTRSGKNRTRIPAPIFSSPIVATRRMRNSKSPTTSVITVIHHPPLPSRRAHKASSIASEEHSQETSDVDIRTRGRNATCTSM